MTLLSGVIVGMGMVVEHSAATALLPGPPPLASAREAGFREAQHVSAASLTQRYFAGTSILSAAPLDYPAVYRTRPPLS